MMAQSTGKKWVLAAGALVVVILLLISGFSYRGFLSYRGFCFSQNRFLSDSDYFEAAIKQIIARDTEQLIPTSEPGTTFRGVPAVKYASIAEFQRLNPLCCETVPHNVGDSGPYTSFSQRLFGYAARTVSITYLVRYIDEMRGQKSTLKTEQFAITNCGRAWH